MSTEIPAGGAAPVAAEAAPAPEPAAAEPVAAEPAAAEPVAAEPAAEPAPEPVAEPVAAEPAAPAEDPFPDFTAYDTATYDQSKGLEGIDPRLHGWLEWYGKLSDERNAKSLADMTRERDNLQTVYDQLWRGDIDPVLRQEQEARATDKAAYEATLAQRNEQLANMEARNKYLEQRNLDVFQAKYGEDVNNATEEQVELTKSLIDADFELEQAWEITVMGADAANMAVELAKQGMSTEHIKLVVGAKFSGAAAAPAPTPPRTPPQGVNTGTVANNAAGTPPAALKVQQNAKGTGFFDAALVAAQRAMKKHNIR